MSYKQTRTPNLNAHARVGWCLEYVQNAFKSDWAGASAWDAWSNRVAHRHANMNFPANVLIPIWFSGTWNGHYYGHVAILNTRTGQVYTSPYFKSAGVEVYNSINAMMSVFRNDMRDITYVGWSEDIGGIRVIERNVSMARRIQNASNWRWRFQRLHHQLVGNWDMSEAVFKSIVGQDPWTVVENWSDHENSNQTTEFQRIGQKAVQDKWQQQIYNLQDQVKKLGTRPTAAQLNAANQKIADLAQQMESAVAIADAERVKAEESAKKLKEAEEEQAKSKREADNFLTAIINAIRNQFGGK